MAKDNSHHLNRSKRNPVDHPCTLAGLTISAGFKKELFPVLSWAFPMKLFRMDEESRKTYAQWLSSMPRMAWFRQLSIDVLSVVDRLTQ